MGEREKQGEQERPRKACDMAFPKTTTTKTGTKLFPKTMDSVGHDFSEDHGQRGTRVFPKTTDSVGHGFSQRPRTAWDTGFPKDYGQHGTPLSPKTIKSVD